MTLFLFSFLPPPPFKGKSRREPFLGPRNSGQSENDPWTQATHKKSPEGGKWTHPGVSHLPSWNHQKLLLPLRYKTPGTNSLEKADKGNSFLWERLCQYLSNEVPGSPRSVAAATHYNIFSFPLLTSCFTVCSHYSFTLIRRDRRSYIYFLRSDDFVATVV